jgi:hypothetical protein
MTGRSPPTPRGPGAPAEIGADPVSTPPLPIQSSPTESVIEQRRGGQLSQQHRVGDVPIAERTPVVA